MARQPWIDDEKLRPRLWVVYKLGAKGVRPDIIADALGVTPTTVYYDIERLQKIKAAAGVEGTKELSEQDCLDEQRALLAQASQRLVNTTTSLAAYKDWDAYDEAKKPALAALRLHAELLEGKVEALRAEYDEVMRDVKERLLAIKEQVIESKDEKAMKALESALKAVGVDPHIAPAVRDIAAIIARSNALDAAARGDSGRS
jgi:hypothetical protein